MHQASSGNAIFVPGASRIDEPKSERLVQSTPGSPQEVNRPNSFEVVGSAESLVGRVSDRAERTYTLLNAFFCTVSVKVLVEQGLGKYADQDFIRYTSREMQEALDMTSEEMDRAAHELMQQNPPKNCLADSPSNRNRSPQHGKSFNQQMM